MFELKSVVLRDKKTGKNKTRYYTELYLAHGRKVTLILQDKPDCCRKTVP